MDPNIGRCIRAVDLENGITTAVVPRIAASEREGGKA